MGVPIQVKLNKIYLLASVTGNHLQSARDLYNYHIHFDNKQFIEIHTKEVLIQTLINIEQEIGENDGPLIHLEAHGLDSQDGLALSNGIELSSGEQINWEEIRPYLIAINAKCGNNLTMVMATCFGMYILQDLIKTFFDNVVGAQCPFFSFVGPESDIGVDDFTAAFPVFYKNLFETKSFVWSVQEMNKKSSVRFRCDTAYMVFEVCANSFADNQIKNRIQHMMKNPDIISDYYCRLYHYTYGIGCDINAVQRIMQDERFYIDYLNKMKKDFLHVKDGEIDRFPVIDKLIDFEKSVPVIRTLIR
ncbi:MAG: hypothetical protein KDC49_12475 [Saprospiraceae bacterium]|nr:hypothetical protein [Saprospiraceae bacterium]